MLSPSPEQIDWAEEWSQVALGITEKDALWQVQMATVLRRYSRERDAETRCRRALELDPKNWRASHLLAQTVESDQDAIGILTKLTERLQKDSNWMATNVQALSDITFDLGNRYWSTGQFDRAVQTYSKAVKHDPTDERKLLEILSRYDSRKQWSDIIDLMETIRLSDHNQLHLAGMVMKLADREKFHKIFFQATLKTKQFNVLSDLYKHVIQYATDNRMYDVLCYARYYYGLALTKSPTRSDSQVIELLETALEKDSPQSHLGMTKFFMLAGSNLAAMYLRKVRKAKAAADPERTTELLSKMANMIPEELPEWQLDFPPQLFTARYYVLERDYARARHLAHTTFQLSLELLSDDDVSNDILAFERLFFAFVPFGDQKNAATALAMVALCQRTAAAADGEEGEDRSESQEWGFSIPSDGDRERVLWNQPGDVSWCKNCVNIILEGSCQDEVPKGKFQFDICRGAHDPLYIAKCDTERLKNLPAGCVPWGDRDISLEEWKNEIRKYVDAS